MEQLLIDKKQKMRSRKWVISRWALNPSDEVENWPVLAASAPEPEQWMLTGRGSVGVIRQRPGGSAVGFMANLSLERGGIFEYGFFDGIPYDCDYDAYLAETLKESAFYPSVTAPDDWASRYFWDVAEFGSSLPLPPPPPERILFRMLPPSRETMIRYSTGQPSQPSTVPDKLAKLVLGIIESGDFDPEGLPISAKAVFKVKQPEKLFCMMRKNPVFVVKQTESGLFGRVKSPSFQKPDGTRVKICNGGLGFVELARNRLTIRTTPLSALGSLYLVMKVAAKGKIRLLNVSYNISKHSSQTRKQAA